MEQDRVGSEDRLLKSEDLQDCRSKILNNSEAMMIVVDKCYLAVSCPSSVVGRRSSALLLSFLIFMSLCSTKGLVVRG